MALSSIKEITEARDWLKRKYHGRNSAYKVLRRLYNADYWSGKPQIQGIKLVYNLIANVVDRYTDFMSQPPDWRVLPVDMTDEALEMADKEEKLLYSQWELNNILIAQQWQANLQSLLGFFGFEIAPFKNEKIPEKYVSIGVLNPDYILPMPKSDGIRELDYVIVEGFDYTESRDLYTPSLRQDQKADRTNLIKYYDENKIVLIKDNERVGQIDHEFGFLPLILGQNRVKPFFVEGIGDTEQAVGLNEYLNELISWQADIIEYAANPVTLLKGLSPDTNLSTGPGARWNLPPDGEAKFLTWPGQPPEVERMINRVIQAIQDSTNLSDPTFGREIPSGTSGSAVRSLMSGIQSSLLRKQVSLGDAYVRSNEIILKMVEKTRKNEEVAIRGTKKGNVFVEKFTGKEINGNYRNQAIWPPGILDQPSRLQMEVQKRESRLQSRYTTMENVGVLSPKDEIDRLRQEEDEELERELIRSGAVNPQSREFATAANQLSKLQGGAPGGGGQSEEQQLISIVQGIPKVRGSVFFAGRDGDKMVLALTDMKDKATIVNKLPKEFKGRIKFRAFNEDEDAELTPIIDKEEEQE